MWHLQTKWHQKRFATLGGTNICFGPWTNCGQMVRRIKIPLGTEVNIGPGNVVLDGGHSSPLKVFASCVSWPQTAEWMNRSA